MEKLYDKCLKKILPEHRFMVEYNKKVYCVDCIHHNGTLLLSTDLVTRSSGTMITVKTAEVKYSHEHTIDNNRIIHLLENEGYEEYAEILKTIAHT